MLPIPSQPAPRGEVRSATGHVQGRQWPACRCQLCTDAFICPVAVTRVVRALVLAAALGLAAVGVGSL